MSRLHDWLLDTWYGPTRRGAWLLPLAWLFGLVAALRRILFVRGWRRSYRSCRPVVVVGNVTVGGTGKTPLVIWLALQLRQRGLRVGIASRGYGGSARNARRVSAADPASLVGDEPALVARRTGLPVAVGANRAEAVRLLEEDCDLILCDDGLQHYALQRDAEVVLVDGVRGLGNGWLLPAGPLRETPSRLAAADAVVVHGEGFGLPGCLRMRLLPSRFVELAAGASRSPSSFAGQRAHALAAIGRPGRFFDTLRQLGIEVIPHPLPDHAQPQPSDLYPGDGMPVLMTEKDAVKCPAGAGPELWYLEVDADFDEADAARLLAVVEEARRRHAASA